MFYSLQKEDIMQENQQNKDQQKEYNNINKVKVEEQHGQVYIKYKNN